MIQKRIAFVLLTAGVFGGGLAAGLWIGSNRVPATPPPAWLYSEFNEITRPGLQIQSLIQSRPDLWTEINAELRQLKPRIDEFRAHVHEIDMDFRRDFEAILTEEQKLRLAQAQQDRTLPRIHTEWPKAAQPASPSEGKSAAPAGKVPAVAATTPAASAPSSAAVPAPATPAAAATPAPKPAATATSAPATAAAATKPPTSTPASAAPAPASPPRIYHERSDGLVSSFVFVPYTSAKFSEVLDLDEDQEEKLNLLLAERRTRFLRLCDDTPPPSLQLNRIADIIRRAQANTGKSGK
jgi:hypothetical protein